MPASSSEAIKRKNDNRKLREALNPLLKEQRNAARRLADAKARLERPREYRERKRIVDRKRDRARSERARLRRDELPFLGCDGEGLGRDPHRYAMLRIGDAELGPFKGDRALTSWECLDFIIAAPPDSEAIKVWFAGDYDTSNILRDLSSKRQGNYASELERLFALDTTERRDAGPSFKKFFWTRVRAPDRAMYGVKYIQRKYLKVCRMTWSETKRAYVSIKGTVRTIFDVFGFFQSSFVAALKAFDVGVAEIEQIETMKRLRGEFDGMTRAVRDYCQRECELLAELMSIFRKLCLDCDIRPDTWSGAGKLAAALHKKHGTLRKAELDDIVPADVLNHAKRAYYGGRFEISMVGLIDRPVWENDLKSAYPAAMLELPCLRHGRWRKASGDELQRLLSSKSGGSSNATFVCPVTFTNESMNYKDRLMWCGLPIRQSGSISWPRIGKGTYWSVELRSALKLGAVIQCHAGWLFERGPGCQCQPFDWVSKYYHDRQRIVETLGTAAGVPIKLGLNSLYGKLAQRIDGTYSNWIWAGLITAITRAKLNDVIARVGPSNVAMIATDGIYTLKSVPKLDEGSGLGQWETKKFDGLFIAKPGMYWPMVDGIADRGHKQRPKTRGVSLNNLNPYLLDFSDAWRIYMKRFELDEWMGPPRVPIVVQSFTSLRLAFRRNDMTQACRWETNELFLSFDWHDKRDIHWPSRDREAMLTSVRYGSHSFVSELPKGMEDRLDGSMAEPPELLFEGNPDADNRDDLIPGLLPDRPDAW